MDYVGLEEYKKTGMEFVFGLIGGIIWLLIGLGIFGWIVFDLSFVGFTGGNPDDKMAFFVKIGIALYLSVISVWVITGAYWMKSEDKARRGAWTCIVLGVLSANILAIIAGIIGLNKNKLGNGFVSLSKNKFDFEEPRAPRVPIVKIPKASYIVRDNLNKEPGIKIIGG